MSLLANSVFVQLLDPSLPFPKILKRIYSRPMNSKCIIEQDLICINNGLQDPRLDDPATPPTHLQFFVSQCVRYYGLLYREIDFSPSQQHAIVDTLEV